MRVRLVPNEDQLPQFGGVRQHCIMLRRFVGQICELTEDPEAITHVQSSYVAPRVDVYTCHGGFVPSIKAVHSNLQKASRIISVAQWIVDRYFPHLASKTIVIPNGVDLDEWEELPHNTFGLEPGFVLAKGYTVHPIHWEPFLFVASTLPTVQFVVFGSPIGIVTKNVHVVPPGTPFEHVQGLLNDCALYVSCGTEVNSVMTLEAWAARRPVIGMRIDGNTELLPPDVHYYDETKLRQLIVALLKSDSHRQQVGEIGRQKVESDHDWRDLAEAVLYEYEEVVRESTS